MLPLIQRECAAPGLHVEVHPYLLGQFRIMLMAGPWEQSPPLRQMCTYRPEVMEQMVDLLVAAPDPVAFCKTLERPWNCESPGGRIRLDNVQEDRR